MMPGAGLLALLVEMRRMEGDGGATRTRGRKMSALVNSVRMSASFVG